MVPGGEYDADRMRFLLNAIKDSVYAVFWVGQNEADLPNGSVYNASVGFRGGSLGFNPYTKRKYICVAADNTSATWEMISTDLGFAEQSANNGGTYQIPTSASNVSIYASVTNFDLKLPANPYVGKIVSVKTTGAITNLSIKTSTGSFMVVFTTTANTYFQYMWNGSYWDLLMKITP